MAVSELDSQIRRAILGAFLTELMPGAGPKSMLITRSVDSNLRR